MSSSSEEEEASVEGSKVLSLQRWASRTVGLCFTSGRKSALESMKTLGIPKRLTRCILRYVILSRSEWEAFVVREQTTMNPSWCPEGSPLQRRVAFYERRYGKDTRSKRWDFVWRNNIWETHVHT